MSGLTSDGLSRPLLDEIAAEILADERGTISGQLDGSESTAIGNINTIFADQLSQAWEVLEEAYNGMDPENASDNRLVAIALLTGVTRLGATNGLVSATVNLSASTTFQPGDLTAHVFNEPSNRWVNRDVVMSTTAGNYSAVFQSENTGSATTAAAGTLTVIASPITGWNSITNALDATPGKDQESIESLRARRDASLAVQGSGTVDAIRADVVAVTNVLEALVEENTTDVVVGSLPPHSVHIIVWDGSPAAAADNDIAQAIYGTRPAGIASPGTQSGTALRKDGTPVTINFDRASVVDTYVSVQIISAVGVTIADVKAAILAAMPTAVGGDVIYARIAGAVFAVPGVDDYVFVHIGTAPSPSGTTNIAISSSQIAQLNAVHIVVTGDAT